MKLKLPKFKPVRVIGIFIAILIIMLTFLLIFQITRIEEKNELEMTRHYIDFQRKLNAYIVNNTSLIKGFIAYIEMNGDSDTEQIYIYLSHLMEDQMDDIKNIGIIKDTTILLNYPIEGNEDSIGIDLSLVEGQAAQVAYVKDNLQTHFQGPVNLVQGGKGYIIREPIFREGHYWGMVSIVLIGEAFDAIIEEFSQEADLYVLINDINNDNQLIYGDESMFNKSNMSFINSDFFGKWTITIKHRTPETKQDYVALSSMIALYLFISYILTKTLYNYLNKYQSTTEANKVLSEQVTRDSLTGVSSRNYFISKIFDNVSYATHQQHSIALVFCDIDYFKRVNDQYGHAVGDEVLYEVAKIFSSTIRKSDIVTRWGGEEFLIMLTRVSLDEAAVVAEKMRAQVEAKAFTNAQNITASFGVVMYREDEFIGTCIKRADQAMYKAKQQGRNQVVIDTTDTAEEPSMKKSTWQEKWTCGNPIIDTEHMELLETLNEIIELSFFKEQRELLLNQLYTYFIEMEKHFKDEEVILTNIRWENLYNHKKIHEALLNELLKFTEDYRGREISTEVFVQKLLDNIISHIEVDDMKFFEWL